MAAVDRQPQPPRGGARPAAGDHRGGRRRARRRAALADQPGRRARPAPGRDRRARSRRPPRPPATSRACWSTSPSGTAAGARSPTPYGPCCSTTPRRAPRSRSWPTILDVEHIADHLYTKGQPDPDLVIRTSGEQRLGGFLLWQSRAQRVLLLRGLLARLPSRRLPAGAPGVRRAPPPLRRLTSSSRPARRPPGGLPGPWTLARRTPLVNVRPRVTRAGRACLRGRRRSGPTVGDSTGRGSPVRREARS